MNSKFLGKKNPSHHFSQIFGMHHTYSLYPSQSKIHCRFKGHFIPIQESHISGPWAQDMRAISYGHIMCESNTSGLQDMMISNMQ